MHLCTKQGHCHVAKNRGRGWDIGVSSSNLDTASKILCDLGHLLAHSANPESVLGNLSHPSGIRRLKTVNRH